MRGEKGASLITVLILSAITLFLVGGIFYLLHRSIRVSASVPVYMTLRDAAAGGVHYAATQIKSGYIIIDSVNQCQYLDLSFRLGSSGDTYTNRVTVCLIGFTPPPGFKVTGAAYSKVIPGGKGNVYSIVSEAFGPNNTYSRIEAVFTP